MKSRSVIIVVITLIIGFVLGFLTSSQLRNQKLKPVRVFFSEERFREGFYNVIQPSDEQKVIIEQVLDKYAGEMGNLQTEFRRNFDAKMRAFRKEIDSKLTKEQLARLKEMDEKREEMIRQGRRNRGNDSINRRFDDRYDERPHREAPPHRYERSDSGHADTTR